MYSFQQTSSSPTRPVVYPPLRTGQLPSGGYKMHNRQSLRSKKDRVKLITPTCCSDGWSTWSSHNPSRELWGTLQARRKTSGYLSAGGRNSRSLRGNDNELPV